MAKKRTNPPTNVLEFPVAFGGVSIGDKTCRIGISVDRSQLSVDQADDHLCEKRLTGSIISRPQGDLPDQGTLPGMAFQSVLRGVFDVKGFSVSADAISFGLTFAIASIDIEKLAHFAKRAGRVVVEEEESIPEAGANGDDEDDDEEEEVSVVERGRRHLEGK